MAWRRRSQQPKAANQDAGVGRMRIAPKVRTLLASIEKQFGKGTAILLGDSPPHLPSKGACETGTLALDFALGCGGWPRGRICELSGPPGGGKTSLAFAAIARVQSTGGTAAYLDVEHAFDLGFARSAGVDTDALILAQPDDGEQALEIVQQMVRSNAVDLVVLDSVAALAPRAELDGEIGDGPPNQLARLMSAGLRSISASLGASTCAVVLVNQLRTHTHENEPAQEVTAGGNALKFYAAIRVDVRTVAPLFAPAPPDAHGRSGIRIGTRCRVRTLKNKVGRPFEEVEFNLRFDSGVDGVTELIEMGLHLGVLERSGGVYFHQGNALGTAAEARASLVAHAVVAAEIDAEVRKRLAEQSRPGAAAPVAQAPRAPVVDVKRAEPERERESAMALSLAG